MPDFPFVGSSYATRSKRFDAQRSINLYPELSESGTSRTVAALYGTPGLALWLTLAGGGIRGALRVKTSDAVVVAGQNVYRVSAGPVATLLGGITAGSTPVGIATNGQQVAIVTGPTGYVVDLTTWVMTQITNAAFTGADRVDFMDGYFVFNKPGTGQFQISKLYSADIDPFDFATAEGSPDLLLSLIVDHRELWLFGETSTEVFYDSGNTDFPLERINGAFIEVGCAAKYSVAKLDNTVFWLGADDRGRGIVYRAVGYQAQRCSNHGVEYALSQMSTLSDAVAYTYQQEGHSFYVLNFPSANQTWVFDAATNEWHERAYRNPHTAQLERHRAQCHMVFGDDNIVGDWESGTLYRLDMDAHTDNGAPIPRIRRCQHIAKNDRWMFHRRFQVLMDTGIGIPSGQGSDPIGVLSWSDDGGSTWSNRLHCSLGKLGERETRAVFRRLGRSRDRIYEFEISDPVRVCIIGATLDVDAA